MIMKQIAISSFLRELVGTPPDSSPKIQRVEPKGSSAPLANLIQHMPRTAGPVAALAVPEADEIALLGPEPECGVEHPAIVALVRILAFGRRAKLARRDMEDAARFGGEKPGAPVPVGEIDRPFEKPGLLERDVELEAGAARG